MFGSLAGRRTDGCMLLFETRVERRWERVIGLHVSSTASAELVLTTGEERVVLRVAVYVVLCCVMLVLYCMYVLYTVCGMRGVRLVVTVG
jgi:hypothetical protein